MIQEPTQTPTIPTTPSPPPSIYFGGCGYGLPYYIGVYRAMRDRWGPDFPDMTTFCGDGVGSLMAVGITMRYTPESMKQVYMDLGKDVFGSPEAFEEKCLIPFLHRYPQALEKVNDKCLLGTGRFFSQHVWRTHWDNEAELLQDLRNAMHIPVLFKRVQNDCGKMDYHEIVDGTYSLSGRELPHGNNTLCIGCDSTFDIPVHIPLSQQLFLQRGSAFQELYDKGYRAFSQWDGVLNAKATQKQPNFLALVVLWLLKLLELLIEFAEFYKEIVL